MISGKNYGLGFIVGRFQVFHLGHASLIRKSMEMADKTIVLVGSADKRRTMDNPFSFEERKAMIQKVFPDVIVLPLDDIGVGNVPSWGDYLFKSILEKEGRYPDLYVCGNEAKVDMWFDERKKDHLHIERVERSDIPISATQLRNDIVQGKKESFLKYVPKELDPLYPDIRKTLISVMK